MLLKSADAQHVALAAGDVAGLRVGRRAGLVLPGEVLLQHQAQLAGRLAVARIGSLPVPCIDVARRIGAVGSPTARRGNSVQLRLHACG